jgi:UDP-glucose:(heptosyl)LPS alpha-1,3-glucosyltransferase
MKVALSIESFDPKRGGGETYCRNFTRALLKAGHEVHIYTNEFGPEEPGVVMHQIPPTPLHIYRRFAFAKRAQEMLQKEQFDIIHGFGKSVYMDVFRPGGGVHRAWQEQEVKAVGGGLPRMMTRLRQFASIDQRLVLHLERRQFGGSAGPHIVAVSKMVANEAQRYYGTPAERISVIYNGVDLERHRPQNRELYRKDMRRQLNLGEEVALLFVGHNYKRKGLAPLLRAMPALRQWGVPLRLIVLGEGRRGPMDAIIDRLRIQDVVQFAGVSSNVEQFYAAADVMVFPSYYDPCANVVFEALASGLPVITSIYNGSGEILTDGINGFVVDPDDPAAMAKSIAYFFDPDIRRTASTAARQLAETRPISHNFGEIMAVYDKVLAGRARGLRTRLD